MSLNIYIKFKDEKCMSKPEFPSLINMDKKITRYKMKQARTRLTYNRTEYE